MDTNKILRSTLTEETRTQKGDTKTCLLGGLRYFLRPILSRENLGLTDSSKQVQQCKTYPEHLELSSQVVKELKERDTHAKQEDREVVKRSGYRPTSWEMHRLQRWSGTSPSFVIVLTRSLRWSPSFPANRNHSLDSRYSPTSSFKKKRYGAALRSWRVWRQGFRRGMEWRKGSCFTRRCTRL